MDTLRSRFAIRETAQPLAHRPSSPENSLSEDTANPSSGDLSNGPVAPAMADGGSLGISAEQFRKELATRNISASTPLPRKTQSNRFGLEPHQRLAASQIPTASTWKPPVPVPIDLSETLLTIANPISRLNGLCQSHGLQYPVYDFKEHGISGAGIFDVKLSLLLPKSLATSVDAVIVAQGGDGPSRVSMESSESAEHVVLVVEDDGYKNKKDSKQAAADRAFDLLKQAVKLDLDLGTGSSGTSAAAPVQQEDNYVGLLLEQPLMPDSFDADMRERYGIEFANATSTEGPIYTPFALGMHFSCTVAIHAPAEPGMVQSQTLTFGSSTVPFNTKKAARAAAAKEAVEYLRLQGVLEGSGAPPLTKKRRLASNASSGLSAHPAPSSSGSDLAMGPAPPTLASGSTTYAYNVTVLCNKLGLSNMAYRISPTNEHGGLSMYSGAAYFRDEVDPRLCGPVGSVTSVYGQKNAKEEIALQVCAVLQAILEERLAGISR